MKKKLLLLVVLFASIGLANAQTLSIPDVYVQKGGKASFGLVVNVPANSYAGFQFETTLPTGLNYTGKTQVIDDWDGSFSTSSINYKGSSSSGTLTPIPAGEMVIATAEIDAAASMAVGEYNVTISNFEFLGFSGGAEDKKIADVTFKVIVTDILTLDENAAAAPADADDVDVLVKRSIKANEWSTICLPFSMDEDQVKAAFGNDVELGEFSKHTYDSDADAINVIFTAAEEIEANTPYIIKVSSAITEFNVDGVTIEAGKVSKGSSSKGYFLGTYVAGTIVPNFDLFINDNKFWYSNGKTKIKAFRGYFQFKNILVSAKDELSSARIIISFDETTGVKTIKAEGNESYYDLQGRHVNEPTKKGLYIRGNKKVFIK